MNKKIIQVKKQLHQLEKKIKETKKRMPAHSVKPPIVAELFDLEDQYETLSQKLQHLTRDATYEEEYD